MPLCPGSEWISFDFIYLIVYFLSDVNFFRAVCLVGVVFFIVCCLNLYCFVCFVGFVSTEFTFITVHSFNLSLEATCKIH